MRRQRHGVKQKTLCTRKACAITIWTKKPEPIDSLHNRQYLLAQHTFGET